MSDLNLSSEFISSEYAEILDIFKKIRPEQKGSQLVITVGGQKVVDLSAGVDPDNLTTIFSVSKVLSAIALGKIASDGELDFDEKVSYYWPEFAENGKREITVRQMLSHQAGLTATDPQLTLEMIHDDHEAASALAKQKPLWRPGAGFGYHGLTLGPLISELCFRITGLTIQNYYEENVRQLAAADAFLGLPEALEFRVKEMNPNRLEPTDEIAAAFSRNPDVRQSGLSQWGMGTIPIRERYSRAGRAFGLASSEGVASARGLAQLMQWATGFGGQNPGVETQVLEDMSQLQVYGYDLSLEQDHRAYGTIFQKCSSLMPFGSYQAFGHDGAAGSLLYADPKGEIIFSYSVARFTSPGGYDREIQPIIDLVRKIATAN